MVDLESLRRHRIRYRIHCIGRHDCTQWFLYYFFKDRYSIVNTKKGSMLLVVTSKCPSRNLAPVDRSTRAITETSLSKLTRESLDLWIVVGIFLSKRNNVLHGFSSRKEVCTTKQRFCFCLYWWILCTAW